MYKYLCIFVLNLWFSFTVSSSPIEFWNLIPINTYEESGEKYHSYHALCLSSQNQKIQLSIQGNGNEKITIWTKVDESTTTFPFGSEFILHINALNPEKCFLEFNGESINCELQCNLPNACEEVSSVDNSIFNNLFLISGQGYFAHKAIFTNLNYEYGGTSCHDWGWDSYTTCYQTQVLTLDIEMESANNLTKLYYNFSDNVMIYSESSRDKSDINVVKNPYIITCKNWTIDDEIVVLVHQYYPAYKWIVNISRGGEAFFCVGDNPQNLVNNIWELQ